MKLNFKCILFFLLIISCKQVQKVSDAITKPSARDIFERSFEADDSIFKIYKTKYSRAKNNHLELELPTVLNTRSDSTDFRILAYTVNLKRGERFNIQSDSNSDSLNLAIDLFSYKNDSVVAEKPIISNEPKSNSLEFDVTTSGLYKVVILSSRKENVNFGLQFFREPTLAFPVSGKDNAAIQSFWGASRGGGSRSHKGIDIFAKRGTPVVAATNGYISNTGNRGLGGKQVWLRDGVFGQSLYYAHLDSIAVSGGERVKVGDTLGFVGNTGNAKTTAPHLHFGIYARGGAVDPLPFVKQSTAPEINKIKLFSQGLTRLKTNELRIGAGIKNSKIKDIGAKVNVEVLSKTKRWLHIKVNDSLEGFMHESLVKMVL